MRIDSPYTSGPSYRTRQSQPLAGSGAIYRRRRLAAAICIFSLAGFAKVGVAGALASLQPGARGAASAGGLTGPATVAARMDALGTSTAARSEPRYHVVRPGESLWMIAESEHQSGDIRRLVRALAQANGGADLRIGQHVLLPSR